MNRSTLARRYAPLVALAVLQLLIIGFVPSKSAERNKVTVGGSRGNGGGSGTANYGTPAGGPGGVASTASGAGGGALSTASGALGGLLPGGGDTGGDTSHCVNGFEFDPAIAFWAPPCVAGTVGATGGNPAGSTYQGVTGDEILLLDYVTNYGAEVNAILQAQGSLITYSDAQVLDKAYEKFINDHYVLRGRHVKIQTYQGTCQSVPPKYDCLLPEMDSIVNTYHPFAIYWNTTLCSACYAELARVKTIAVGGQGFSDALAKALSPYFYAAQSSATTIEQHFAEWYCAQMTGPVKYAGHQNKLQDFNGQKRVLGIISTNDPDNKDTVNNFLVPLLQQKCGVSVTHFYFYDQDINTAATQVAAGIAAMDTPSNPATTVLCLCDQVAPAFLYSGEQSNNYYPENVIATNQMMDYDKVGQNYGPHGTLGCPSPNLGCEYDLAMGVSEIGTELPKDDDEGMHIYKLGGGPAQLPGSVEGATLTTQGKQWIMFANLIEAAGDNLTPDTIAAAGPTLGSLGGPGSPHELLRFNSWGGYWSQDARLVYFDSDKASGYNGKPGAYVQVGDRVTLGNWQSTPDGEPAIPIGPRYHGAQ